MRRCCCEPVDCYTSDCGNCAAGTSPSYYRLRLADVNIEREVCRTCADGDKIWLALVYSTINADWPLTQGGGIGFGTWPVDTYSLCAWTWSTDALSGTGTGASVIKINDTCPETDLCTIPHNAGLGILLYRTATGKFRLIIKAGIREDSTPAVEVTLFDSGEVTVADCDASFSLANSITDPSYGTDDVWNLGHDGTATLAPCVSATAPTANPLLPIDFDIEGVEAVQCYAWKPTIDPTSRIKVEGDVVDEVAGEWLFTIGSDASLSECFQVRYSNDDCATWVPRLDPPYGDIYVTAEWVGCGLVRLKLAMGEDPVNGDIFFGQTLTSPCLASMTLTNLLTAFRPQEFDLTTILCDTEVEAAYGKNGTATGVIR